MRFVPDGPFIPDDLLYARDEGRVVFFCGAGVSRARAGLANFFELAEAVLKDLGVPSDDPTSQLLYEAKSIQSRTGTGLISADRIFGLLERNFPTKDVERAVAKALRPKRNVDLSAHKILLDLATTPEGKVRLVTTNFDRLFENCRKKVAIARPPRLPDPSRQAEMDCIVHLHGCVSKDYSESEGDGFVLSSSEFGRAYLSDGWATQFFRAILEKYVVVFIGYTADDPPVQYLLEALNRAPGATARNVFAFQSGEDSEVAGKWLYKGVQGIAYAEANNHNALWTTLEEWAARARDPAAWQRSIIEMARRKPHELMPYQRGQIAHLISGLEGARLFAECSPPLPAEWLCVFDPYRRYASPGRKYSESDVPIADPFDAFGIDSDSVPSRSGAEGNRENSQLMQEAWDGFAANRLDGLNLKPGSLANLRGSRAGEPSRLPPRLEQMGRWIANVSSQPACAWWAAYQRGLHSDIQQQIKFALNRETRADHASVLVRRAWWYLFEAWDQKPADFRLDWYELKPSIEKDGWSVTSVRRFAAIMRPYFKVEPNTWNGPLPPTDSNDLHIRDLLHLDVAYPAVVNDVTPSNDLLAPLVREQRKNLEVAVALEEEIGGLGFLNLEPIEPGDDASHNHHSRSEGLSGHIISFSHLFERLVVASPSLAISEFSDWGGDADVFAKLRVWAIGKPSIASPKVVEQTVLSLSDHAFWSSENQRDLLLTLSRRWKDLAVAGRKRIERRILSGRAQFEGEEETEYNERRAWGVLNRIHWLASRECEFSFDVDAKTSRLTKLVPEWQPKFSNDAAESRGHRGGFVRTDTEHSELLTTPIESVLQKASELSGRTDDFLVEKDPFAGLCVDHPVRALRVLTGDAKRGSFPEWAWRTFLRADYRKNDQARLSSAIGARLGSYPSSALRTLVRPVADWLLRSSEQLSVSDPELLRVLVSKLTHVLNDDPSLGRSGIVRSASGIDWPMEAINSPAGHIAQALMKDPRKSDLKAKAGLPPEWRSQAEDLLALPRELRCHVLAILSYNLNWFYWVDPAWTERSLISALEASDADQKNAAWSGFLWGARAPSEQLFTRIKAAILETAIALPVARRGYSESLAGFILMGWGVRGAGGRTCISDAEMRGALLTADDAFRMHVLWYLKTWSQGKNGAMWRKRKLAFLENVWPRQRAVKTPAVSARLSDLVFSDPRDFPDACKAVLPLLTTADQTNLVLPELRKAKNTIVDRYPEDTVAILSAILPEDVASWPYGIGEVLERLYERIEQPVRDEKLLELKRRWDAR